MEFNLTSVLVKENQDISETIELIDSLKSEYKIIVLTGAPGVGKSRVFEQVSGLFDNCSPENFREMGNAHKWIEHKIAEMEQALTEDSGLWIFDRFLESSLVFSGLAFREISRFMVSEIVYVNIMREECKRIESLTKKHQENNFELEPDLSFDLSWNQGRFLRDMLMYLKILDGVSDYV